MLSPPPEGTFDVGEEERPIKSPRNGKIPDQVLLLTHDENEEAAHEEEVAESNSNVSNKPKVRMNLFIYLQSYMPCRKYLPIWCKLCISFFEKRDTFYFSMWGTVLSDSNLIAMVGWLQVFQLLICFHV